MSIDRNTSVIQVNQLYFVSSLHGLKPCIPVSSHPILKANSETCYQLHTVHARALCGYNHCQLQYSRSHNCCNNFLVVSTIPLPTALLFSQRGEREHGRYFMPSPPLVIASLGALSTHTNPSYVVYIHSIREHRFLNLLAALCSTTAQLLCQPSTIFPSAISFKRKQSCQ